MIYYFNINFAHQRFHFPVIRPTGKIQLGQRESYIVDNIYNKLSYRSPSSEHFIEC